MTISVDGIEMVVMVFATLAQALAGTAPALGIIGALIVWRFVVSFRIPFQDYQHQTVPADGGRYRRRLSFKCGDSF